MAIKFKQTSFMSLQERKKRLTKAIQEMELEDFAQPLIQLYKDQLERVNLLLEEENGKRF